MNAIKSWYDYISEFKYNFQSINSTFTSLVMQIVRIDATQQFGKARYGQWCESQGNIVQWTKWMMDLQCCLIVF